jgi:hypothetical protein
MAESQRIVLRATGPERTASVAALTTAAGAVACGVCCVLPFAFPAVAAAGTGSLLAWFGEAHSWATALAGVIVAGAWISIGLQSRRARRRPSGATLYTMALASAVLVLAVLWPCIEPHVIRAVTHR